MEKILLSDGNILVKVHALYRFWKSRYKIININWILKCEEMDVRLKTPQNQFKVAVNIKKIFGERKLNRNIIVSRVHSIYMVKK